MCTILEVSCEVCLEEGLFSSPAVPCGTSFRATYEGLRMLKYEWCNESSSVQAGLWLLLINHLEYYWFCQVPLGNVGQCKECYISLQLLLLKRYIVMGLNYIVQYG